VGIKNSLFTKISIDRDWNLHPTAKWSLFFAFLGGLKAKKYEKLNHGSRTNGFT
jgi:hypothetical protein